MRVKNFLSGFDYQYSSAPRDAGGPRSERGAVSDRVRIAGEHTCKGCFQGFSVYLKISKEEVIFIDKIKSKAANLKNSLEFQN